MTPYFDDESVTLFHGDCLGVMASLPDASVDAVVTDPPYGLGFMGKAWDDLPPGEEWARECLRVLKPGGYLLAFGGTRTWHRLAVAVEDAGLEVRDSIAWLYGSGFPKSLDVSKAIDKAAGATREITAPNRWAFKGEQNTDGAAVLRAGETKSFVRVPETAPATSLAQQWQGWGTALKPAFEPIVVARKPLAGTVAANVLAHGTGALNIAACRVEPTGESRPRIDEASQERRYTDAGGTNFAATPGVRGGAPEGRWPTNVTLDGSQADELDRRSGISRDGVAVNRNREAGTMSSWYGTRASQTGEDVTYGGEGGASRFFPTFRYEAKAPTDERPRVDGVAHPTVKPLDLMRWLVRLVTPPGGVVLEPFAGSGTTAEACVIEGFRCIAIEREAAYLPLIEARLSKPIQPDLFGGVA